MDSNFEVTCLASWKTVGETMARKLGKAKFSISPRKFLVKEAKGGICGTDT